MGTFTNVAIIGAVLTIVGFSLIVGSGTDSDATVMVDRVGIVLAIGGIGLAIIAGIGGGIKTAIKVGKKSAPAGIALAIIVAIASAIVILMLLPCLSVSYVS